MNFSVIIPSYNQGQFISEALESVLKNTAHLSALPDTGEKHKNTIPVEIIVVDNCSTDGTREVVHSVIQQFGSANIHFISEPDRGQTEAINKGLEISTGEILTYLCADDFYESYTFTAVLAAFNEDPDADVVYGDGHFLEGDSGWRRLKRAGPFSIERLRNRNFVIQPATFWRRRVYEEFGPLDDSLHYCMDNEYWLRIADQTTWYYCHQPLATARLHCDAKTSSQLVNAWNETAFMAERYGIGTRYQFIAIQMRLYGAWWYGFKRRILRQLGKVRMLLLRFIP
ncbi:MAG: glycosyltransferase family 2 protein [Verrucomicrobiota bacterium]